MINNLRVIGGKLRGRTLLSPSGTQTRPTADRTREALFQLLDSKYLPAGFESLQVIDLYAGSGALGIEALSRGAAHVHAFESGGLAGKVMRQNIEDLKLKGELTLHSASLPRGLESFNGHADLIFCDSPYEQDPVAMLQSILPTRARARAILVHEHERGGRPVLKMPWRLLERRTWGLATVSIFRLEGDPTPT